MSFFISPGEKEKATPKTSSFFVQPTASQAKSMDLAAQAEKARVESEKANSFVGQAKSVYDSTFGKIVNDVKQVVTAPMAPKTFGSLTQPNSPNSFLNTGVQAEKDIINDVRSKFSEARSINNNPSSTTADKFNASGKAILSLAGIAFSPVSVPLQAATTLPVVGYAADVINKVFGAIGVAGGDITEQSLQGLPISQETKTKITPLIKEIGSLSAQIIAGKTGGDAIGKLTDKSKAVAAEVHKDVISQSTENKIPISTPGTRYADYRASQGYEPYADPNTLPVIQMGKKSSDSSLPTIQIGAKNSKSSNGLTYEPVSPPSSPIQSLADNSEPITRVVPTSNTLPATDVAARTAPTIESSTRQSGLAKTAEAISVAKDIETNFGELPTYTSRNMTEAASKAIDFIESNPGAARAVLEGKSAPPEGLLYGDVYSALSRKAFNEGDAALIKDLATSKTANDIATAYGQNVKAFDTGLEHNPVTAVKEVIQAREQGATMKSGSMFKKGDIEKEKVKVVDTIKQEIKKTKVTKQTWESFVKELQC